MQKFRVELKKIVDDSYDVRIGRNLIPELVEDLKGGLVGNCKKFAVVTDTNVRDLYAAPLVENLREAGFSADLCGFPAGEKSKVRKTKEQIEDAMLEKGFRRDCCVIAAGGGVVSDLAGFIAGTFGRGVPYVNYTTSLLAAADASIGGKTAVDTELATNLIGLIYQPKKVYVDIDTWKTLPKEHVINGLAETVKHACLADAQFFSYIEDHVEDILNCVPDVCEYISEKNCRVKYEVVMKDEKEQNLREILNLGHTVGRAIETVSGYQLLHGQALSIGMTAQVNLGCKLKFLTEEERDRVIALQKRIGLPVSIPDGIDRDKKVRDGKLRFVFQKGIGDVMTFGEDVYARPVAECEIREIIMEM